MKKHVLLLALSFLWVIVSAQTVKMTYHFDNPVVSDIQEYKQIHFEGCMQTAIAGNPTLPYYSVSLLLPQGTEAESIEVILSDFVEMDGSYNLFPHQPARPYSKPERTVFMKNEEIYNSKSTYPFENHGILTTNHMNGYAFAFSSFTPVQYTPSTGKIRYARTATVVVNTVADKTDRSAMLWNTPNINNKVLSLAQNPEMIDNYKATAKSSSAYDLLVITKEQFIPEFDEYLNFYDSIGLRSRIVSLESIYNEMTGVDQQEKIRNYIIREYQDNGIMMVLLGGDVQHFPYRGFYCVVQSSSVYEDSGIPADLYFAALDGTWNDNNNDKWGEIGEEDLLPEIGIARMPFNTTEELHNMINKTIKYQRSPVLGELRNVIMGAEWLYDNPQTYGSGYLELLIGEHDDNGYTTIGMPEDLNFTRLYEEEGNWSGNNLIEAINQGSQYVHHVGHANETYVAGWDYNQISSSIFSNVNGVDHNYTFFHSHGCMCASFDVTSILEAMVTIPNFCVSVIGNSRYGWFNEGQTEGPSAHLHREMTDAYFNDRIPYIGNAMTDGKCQTAPWVNAPGQWEEGALRWNFYDLNILGDVAVSPWLDEPFTPTVEYNQEILVGMSSTVVNVYNDNNPQKGFRCSLFNGDELLGVALTDENGEAEITMNSPINTVGTLTLIVTGLNAYPQIFQMTSIPNNSAYVVYYDYSLNDDNGKMDFGETTSFNMTLRNAGMIDANNVIATLSCNSEYVTIMDSQTEVGTIAGEEDIELNDVFEFSISDNVPNNTSVKFTLTCTDGTDSWESSFNATLNAPDFKVVNIVLDDSQGNNNGNVDPGETITLHLTGKNTGNSPVPYAVFAVFCSAPEVSYSQNEFVIDNIEEGEEFTTDFTFTMSENTETGIAYEFILAIYYDNYLIYDSYTFPVGNTTETFETGDFSAFDWSHSGNQQWTIVSENPHSGTYCAKSGAIDDYQNSTLSIEIEIFVETEISFFVKVSSESNYDKLNFYVDNSKMEEWSGEVEWNQVSYTLPSGSHQLTWTYEKDSSLSSGSDCAWIDDIVFPPTTIIYDLETSEENNIEIYPNPASSNIYVETGDNECDILIYNSLGQIVKTMSSVSGKVSVDVNDMNSGIYFIKIKGSSLNEVRNVVIYK